MTVSTDSAPLLMYSLGSVFSLGLEFALAQLYEQSLCSHASPWRQMLEASLYSEDQAFHYLAEFLLLTAGVLSFLEDGRIWPV